MAHENEEFRVLLARLRAERGLSQDDLAYASRELAPKMTGGYIGHLERGEKRASAETIAALARGLEVAPETFTEYRLALARRLFDEKAVGFDQAAANLEAMVLAASEQLEAELAQLARDTSPNDQVEPGRRDQGSRKRKSA